MHCALQAIYTLAFLCLLRSDEVLKIQSSHIQFVKEEDTEYMVITLPFRKTHQDGRVWACFILIFFRANNLRCQTFSRFISTPWMRTRLTCAQFVPWRNGSRFKASDITSGFLFRKFTAQDCPSAHKDQAMVSLHEL